MRILSQLAQNLDPLLTVAESLEGKLPGRDEAEKKKANLTSIFVQSLGNEINFQPKQFLRKLMHPKDSYDIEKNFARLNVMYKSILGASEDELRGALRELHSQGAHRAVSNPIETLLMCKYRLNAILTHVAHKKDKVQDFYQFKITWNPHQTAVFKPTMQTRQGHSRTRKVVQWGESRAMGLMTKPIIKKDVANTSVKEPAWMHSKGGDMNDDKVLKYMFYEFAEAITRGIEEGRSTKKGDENDIERMQRQSREFKKAKNDVIEQVRMLPESVQDRLYKLCSNTRFKKELSQFLTLSNQEWEDISKALKR